MTDEQFNGLMDYLSQNKEKKFARLVKERDELIRETNEIRNHNRKVAMRLLGKLMRDWRGGTVSFVRWM